MVCSVGLHASAACAAMRAGIANFVELPYRDNRGEPIIGAMVPEVPTGQRRDDRLIELLTMALAECLQDQSAGRQEEVPLIVGLAEPDRPGGGSELLRSSIIETVQRQLGVRFHRGLSRVIAKGHTSGFEALWVARKLFKAAGVNACVVCGVDSYVNASSLLWLDAVSRLKTVENSDGIIPGEGAAAVLANAQPASRGNGNTQIAGLGFGKESASILSDEALLGVGLTKATKDALAEAGVAMHEIDFRMSDVAGESYGFKEQALTLMKVLKRTRATFPIWHCADSIGDVGAAAGVCELVWCTHAFRNGYAPGPQAIGYCSNLEGDRSVTILKHS
jgi:3-oxoacyl-[acyl-carrier-protein] synthase-1